MDDAPALHRLAMHALRAHCLAGRGPPSLAVLPIEATVWLFHELASGLPQWSSGSGHVSPPIEMLRLWYGGRLDRLKLIGLSDAAAVEIFGGGFDGISHLTLHSAGISAVGAGHIGCSFSSSLVELLVDSCKTLGAAGLAQLCSCTSLRLLRLTDCALALDADGAAPLLRLPVLTELDLNGSPLSAAAATLLCSDRSDRPLRALRLSGSYADDEAAYAAMDLPWLQVLDWSWSRLSGAGAQALALGLGGRLTKLELGHVAELEPGTCTALLPSLARLRTLALPGLVLSAADLRAVLSAPSMRVLDLREVHVQGHADALEAFNSVYTASASLRVLRLDGMRYSGETASLPMALPPMALPEVNLDFEALDREALRHREEAEGGEEAAGAEEAEGEVDYGDVAMAESPDGAAAAALAATTTPAMDAAATAAADGDGGTQPMQISSAAAASVPRPALSVLSASDCSFLKDQTLLARSIHAQMVVLRSTATLRSLCIRGLSLLMALIVHVRPLGLPSLVDFDAAETASGDELLAWASRCPRLRSLDASGNGDITDAGVASLVALRGSLHTLRLNRLHRLTAHSLEPLLELSALRTVELEYTAISAQQQALLPARQLATEAQLRASAALVSLQAAAANREAAVAAARSADPIRYDEATMLALQASPFASLPTRPLTRLPGVVLQWSPMTSVKAGMRCSNLSKS